MRLGLGAMGGLVVSLVQGGEGFIERKEAAVRVLCVLKHSFLVWLRTTREPVRTCIVSLGGVAGMYVCRCVLAKAATVQRK